jgi:hypothetical protein
MQQKSRREALAAQDPGVAEKKIAARNSGENYLIAGGTTVEKKTSCYTSSELIKWGYPLKYTRLRESF